MPRISFPKTIWSKIGTQTGRKENADIKQGLGQVRQSVAPSGNVVLWDPPISLTNRIQEVLTREETFTRDRQKGGANHKMLLQSIEDLKSYATAAQEETKQASA